jgi:acetylornithine deacetylase/succinyl-diaminopimelate desuccinylase-like protein
MQQFDAYIEAHQQRFLDDLSTLLRVPSVSAQGRGLDEASALVRLHLEKLGADVRIFSSEDGSGGAPLVYATIGSGERRLVVYDHYDVQPPEPLEEWHSPPFEPTIRDGKLYARGVADNKGNLMLRIQAVEAWLATQGSLPLQVIFVIEGEEESQSYTLPSFCEHHPDLLRADGCLWETGGREINEQPEVACGAKGIQYVELVARGAAYDLHSSKATVVPNPAWRLTWALSTLKDADERILIPGLYDAVRPPSEADLKALESIPATDDDLLADYGIPAFLGGVRGVERLRRHLFEPTCTICGLVSGYTGEGSKTVLPSLARAKIDFRLVPDMQPQTVLQQLRAHLDAQGFADIDIIDLGGEHPARSDLHAPVVQAMLVAAKQTYGAPAVLSPTMAGTGPMYPLGPALGVPVTSGAGCSYHGTQIHAPNENIRLQDYWLAMRWMGQFIQAFASTPA